MIMGCVASGAVLDELLNMFFRDFLKGEAA